MTTGVTVLSLSVALALAGVSFQTPQQSAEPVFRSSTHAVAVDAAVFSGDRVVPNLDVADFEIRDNGVRQTITAADFNTLPIDLRIVLDTSGSISEEDLAYYLRTMRQVTATLEPRDRCEIITFTSRIADAASRQHPPITIDLKRAGPDGTAFFDAVSLALITVPTPERRQITVVLSDARDNASFFDEATLLDAARRTDAVVYTILPGDPALARAVSVARLQAVSLLTGGRLFTTRERAVGSVVNEAIREFRQSYVLRYTLTGVALEGWHKLDVKVQTGGRYRIRTRLGYFGH
jgi:VWFA-related protein